MPTLNKLEYLDETKSQIRTALNQFGTEITDNDTFRSYVSKISNIYVNWHKIEATGDNITLNNTKKGKMLLSTAPSELTQETTTGKNTFNNTLTNGSSNGLTYEVNANKSIKITGTATATTYINIGSWNLSGNYIFSGITNGSGTTYRLYLSGTLTNLETITTEEKPITNDGTSYNMILRVESGESVNEIVYPMIRSSSVSDSSYEQYSGGIPQPNLEFPSEVQVIKGNNSIKIENKNLLPNNATSQTIRGITFTINDDKSITLNGTNDNTGSSTLFFITEVDNFSLPARTYYSIATGVAGVNIGAYDGTNYYTFAGGTTNSITFANNITFASVYLQVSKGNSTTFNNKKIYPILSLTQVSDTDYVPYQEQVFPLNLPNGMEYCKIDTYEDEFEHDGDKWYINKAIGKVVLNGSESNWGTIGDNRYYMPISNKRYLTTQVPCLLFSNYFKAIQYAGGTVGIGEMTEGYYTTGNNNVFFNYNGSNTDLAGFKTWLSTHNTDLYYVLSTPTHTEITDTTLISQLNAIENAVSYDEQTNISQTNTGLPFIISASALMKGGN